MNDLYKRTIKAHSFLIDDKLPFSEKIERILSSFSGLELTDLQSKTREWFEGELIEINKVFSIYDIKTSQDYEKIKSLDRKKLIKVFSKICAAILREN